MIGFSVHLACIYIGSLYVLLVIRVHVFSKNRMFSMFSSFYKQIQDNLNVFDYRLIFSSTVKVVMDVSIKKQRPNSSGM